MTQNLTAEQVQEYHGVLGHYQAQNNKVNPGPALRWD